MKHLLILFTALTLSLGIAGCGSEAPVEAEGHNVSISKNGDLWTIDADNGQIGYALNVLGIETNVNPDILNEKLTEAGNTVFNYPDEYFDLEKACEKIGLDYEEYRDKETMTITYIDEDIVYPEKSEHSAIIRNIENGKLEIESEPKQIGYALNAMEADKRNPDVIHKSLDGDNDPFNAVVFGTDKKEEILKRICEKYNLDYESVSTAEETVVMYTDNDLVYSEYKY